MTAPAYTGDNVTVSILYTHWFTSLTAASNLYFYQSMFVPLYVYMLE